MLRSIRARITLGSTAIAALVLLALALLLGEQLRHVAGASVAAMAMDDLQAYAADLSNHPGEIPDRPGAGTRILVLAPGGGIAVDTLPAGLAPLVQRTATGAGRLNHAGVSYVVAARTVVNARGTWRLWSVRDTRTADAALAAFGRVALLAIPVILTLVALGSWFLVTAAPRPVHRLRAAADRIRGSGRPGRLPEGSGRDELADLTATLNRFLEAQESAVERERRMVADASHELRTPLAVLTTRLDLARRHAGDAAALESAVVSAQADVAGLSRLATQLLELSALDSDGDRAESTPVGDLVSELMAAVDRARAIAPAAVRVDFDVLGVSDESATVPISAVGFGRIVDNLATNAVRATAEGGVELLLEHDPGRLVLTVADTGRGFPEDFLPHAFDRFTRSEQSRADGSAGSGIGLALVRALAVAAGGRVELRNREGGGAEARVLLPVAERQPPNV
ncbi:MAG: sensor histidine kinase [Amnibacterium sp.]